jgi:hypothetical protein
MQDEIVALAVDAVHRLRGPQRRAAPRQVAHLPRDP